jgi:hypothetical protein
MDRFIRFAGFTGMAGGLLLGVGAGIQAGVGGPLSHAAPTTAFALSAALRLLGAIALLIGVTGVYLRASDRAGLFGLIGYTLAVVNLVLQAGFMWADLFLSSTIARAAPGILDGTVSDDRMSAGGLVTWFFNVSFAVLGIALLRSRVYPRAVGWALVVMGLIALVPLPFDGPIYEVIIGMAAITASVFFIRSVNGAWAGRPARQPAPTGVHG